MLLRIYPMMILYVRGHIYHIIMKMMNTMTPSNGNIFRVTGPLCGDFTGHWWIPLTKASDAEPWCLFWYVPWINGCVNDREAGDLRPHRAHSDVIVMICYSLPWSERISTTLPILIFMNISPCVSELHPLNHTKIDISTFNGPNSCRIIFRLPFRARFISLIHTDKLYILSC